MKRALLTEAGGKCANPGCPNTLTEIHHIREWRVYQAHDEAHMIALCPACHDAVTRGTLRIDDELAYDWKELARENVNRGHLYVEPSSTAAPRLLLGTIAVASKDRRDLVTFSEGPTTELSFRLVDGEIMHLNATIAGVDGVVRARVRDGHFDVPDGSAARLEQRPGRFRITHPLSDDLMAPEAVSQIRQMEPSFGETGSVPILDMQVLEPNVVRIAGVWILGPMQGLVITEQRLMSLLPGGRAPIALEGAGLSSVMLHAGPVDTALFGWA